MKYKNLRICISLWFYWHSILKDILRPEYRFYSKSVFLIIVFKLNGKYYNVVVQI